MPTSGTPPKYSNFSMGGLLAAARPIPSGWGSLFYRVRRSEAPSAPEHRAAGRAVNPAHRQRQAHQLVHARSDAAQVQPLQDHHAGAQQVAMDRMAGRMERFDGEIVDPDQPQPPLREIARALEIEGDEDAGKAAGGPERRVA